MKLALVAVSALFMALAWLLLRGGLNWNFPPLDRELAALDDSVGADRSLHPRALAARAVLSRNYDGLAREMQAISGSLARLRDAASADPQRLAAIDRLASQAARQQDLIERFKNALLQNPLVHFRLLSSLVAASDRYAAVVASVTRLAADVLYLTLDITPAAKRDVRRRLDDLAALERSPNSDGPIQALLVHGRMLHDLLPATDALLKVLFTAVSGPEQQALHAVIAHRLLAARESARRFQVLLCGTLLALLGALVFLGLQLRARSRALQWRASFEHAIAHISTRFINLQNYQIASGVERALGELAECIGADRAYFVLAGAPAHTYRWCVRGTAFPSDWPERALGLATHLGSGEEGIIQVPNVDRASGFRPLDRDLLADMGLYGWLCVLGRGTEGANGILGFDALGERPLVRRNELGLFRMAFDAIADALRREVMQQEKERLQASLQQARSIETLGAFATGIANSFNNIVGAILGHTELIHAQVESDSPPAGSLAEIRRAGERARELADQIFTFGRRGDGGRQQIRVGSLVKETALLINASLPSHVSLVVHEISATTTVLGDPEQLQQVILNVCSNAAEAMEAAGVIEIGMEIREIAHRMHTEHAPLEPGQFAIISISDPGRGMDEATLGRLFEPFFTTKAEANGLGLATVLEILQKHRGTAEVRSVVGVGTHFDIWLPCESNGDSIPLLRAPAISPRGMGQSVLIFDADRARLLRHEEIIAALGYEPIGFTDPTEAKTACLAHPDRFDAALICHRYGTSSALELAASLRETALPIILATVSAADFNAQALADAGISELIHHPLSSVEVAGALMRCVAASIERAAAC